MRRIFRFVLASLIVTPAMAQGTVKETAVEEIRYVIRPSGPDGRAFDIENDQVLEVHYSGVVKTGHAAIMRKLFEDHKDRSKLLKLNNLGKDLEEGLRISGLVSKHGVTTVVGPDDECYSACALIFMAGYRLGYEGPGYTSRYLHVRGKLGFHAPYLNETACAYNNTCEPPQVVYDRAMWHLSSLLLGSTSTKWPPSLVGEMLKVGRDTLLKIETVDQAGRWKINLFGHAENPEITNLQATTACFNLFRWRDDDKYTEYPLEFFKSSALSGWSQQVKRFKEKGGIRIRTPIDNLNVLGCTLRSSDHRTWTIELRGTSVDEMTLQTWQTRSPLLRLDQISAP